MNTASTTNTMTTNTASTVYSRTQESPRAILDGLTYETHRLVALVLAQDVEGQKKREN